MLFGHFHTSQGEQMYYTLNTPHSTHATVCPDASTHAPVVPPKEHVLLAAQASNAACVWLPSLSYTFMSNVTVPASSFLLEEDASENATFSTCKRQGTTLFRLGILLCTYVVVESDIEKRSHYEEHAASLLLNCKITSALGWHVEPSAHLSLISFSTSPMKTASKSRYSLSLSAAVSAEEIRRVKGSVNMLQQLSSCCLLSVSSPAQLVSCPVISPTFVAADYSLSKPLQTCFLYDPLGKALAYVNNISLKAYVQALFPVCKHTFVVIFIETN